MEATGLSPRQKLIAAAFAAGLSPAEISAGLRDDKSPFNSETAIKKIIAQPDTRDVIEELRDSYRKTIYQLDTAKAKEWRDKTTGIAEVVKKGTEELADKFFEKMADIDLDDINPATALRMFELMMKGGDIYSKLKKAAVAPDSLVFGVIQSEESKGDTGLIILPPQVEI